MALLFSYNIATKYLLGDFFRSTKDYRLVSLSLLTKIGVSYSLLLADTFVLTNLVSKIKFINNKIKYYKYIAMWTIFSWFVCIPWLIYSTGCSILKCRAYVINIELPFFY